MSSITGPAKVGGAARAGATFALAGSGVMTAGTLLLAAAARAGACAPMSRTGR